MSKRLEIGLSIVIEHVPDFPPVKSTLSIEGVDGGGLKWQQSFSSGGSDEVDAIKMVTRHTDLPATIASIGGVDPAPVDDAPVVSVEKSSQYKKDQKDFYEKVQADLSEMKHNALRDWVKEHSLPVKFANNVSLADAREMIIAEIRSREA